MERRAGAVENGHGSPWRVAIISARRTASSPAPNNGSELAHDLLLSGEPESLDQFGSLIRAAGNEGERNRVAFLNRDERSLQHGQ